MTKTFWVPLIGLGGVVAAIVGAGARSARPGETPGAQNATRIPVVVELFTSEGCSSCPPADALLSRLQTEQPVRTSEIIAIEEHVDYWDQQGWRDPFSSADWTERQREYAEVLRDHGVYTPEMVVDGSAGFVGSRAQESLQRIQEATSQTKASVNLLTKPAEKGNRLEVHVNVGKIREALGEKESADVWLAVTEAGLNSMVHAGENDGRHLFHAPVLRKLQKLGTVQREKEQGFTTDANISLDSHWVPGNLRAVVFLQEKRSKRILGAASQLIVAAL